MFHVEHLFVNMELAKLVELSGKLGVASPELRAVVREETELNAGLLGKKRMRMDELEKVKLQAEIKERERGG